MIVIYSVPPSLYCAKLRIMLRHKALNWEELSPPGGYGSDEYKRIVPSGNLPALVHDDLVLGDSEAIAEYLEESFPDPPMLPADMRRRALCRQRSRFHDTRLEPQLRALFPHIKRANRDPVFVATQVEKLNLRMQQLIQLLDQSKPAEDDMLSLGDCGLPISLVWVSALSSLFGVDIPCPPRVLEEQERISGYAAVRDELTDYEPKVIAYLQSTA
jgi:glutathione S-transferase/maleylpyruvate isomerase